MLFFVKVDGKYAGFVLIDDNFMVLNKEKGNYDFSEMFILNAYKNKGIRWTSVSMIISASIFVIVLEAGKLLFKPLLLQSFNEGSLNIPESMFSGLLNFTFFKFYLVPLIFIGLAIVLLIIFRKKEQEPVVMQDGNIVTQAQL